MNKKGYISQAEFARRVGIHPVTVGQGVKSGRFKLYRVGKDKLIRYKEAKLAFHLTKNNTKKIGVRKKNTLVRPPPGDTGEDGDISHDLHDAKLTSEKYKALNQKLNYEIAQDKYISFDEVYKTWQGIADNLKKSMLAIADRIGPLAAAEMDSHACTLMLRTEIKRSLQGTVDKYNKTLEGKKDET